jgi:hypothetical protein
LRANGSRERAPDDRFREAIQSRRNMQDYWIASSLTLLAMTRSGPVRPVIASEAKQSMSKPDKVSDGLLRR